MGVGDELFEEVVQRHQLVVHRLAGLPSASLAVLNPTITGLLSSLIRTSPTWRRKFVMWKRLASKVLGAFFFARSASQTFNAWESGIDGAGGGETAARRAARWARGGSGAGAGRGASAVSILARNSGVGRRFSRWPP